jgi:putative transposase
MLLGFIRNITSIIVVMHSLYLYFLGLSLRNTSKALVIFNSEKWNHIVVWNWIQKYNSCNKYKRVSGFIRNEMYSDWLEILWLWIAIEPIHRTILGIYIYEERNMFVAENFIRSLISKYGRHTVYTDVIHAILKHVTFYIWNSDCILL